MSAERPPPRATPTALGETAIWEAFRALPVEGKSLYPALADYMRATGFFGPQGDTLEVGGGDGALWRFGGEELLSRALRAGRVHVSDSDPELVEKYRADPGFRRPGIEIERAEVAELSYRDGQFARLVAVHVLHWCGTPEEVGRAVGEIARVLDPRGRALIVTVDERIHMREVYFLMKEARAALLARGSPCGEEIPDGSPRVLPFCAGNAPVLLARSFASVRRVDCAYAHVVDAAGEDFFVGYLRTLPFVKRAVSEGRLGEEFFAEARRLFRRDIAVHGAFRMSRCDVLYDCRVPR